MRILLLILILGAQLVGADVYSDSERATLRERALALHLDRDAYWLTLLHYAHGVRGHRSRVDDAAFFLAPQGATDPRAELLADLEAFLIPVSGDGPAAGERFPARQAWLMERLGLEAARLPMATCAEFETAIAELGPRSVGLVFPAAYLNTPASMFGHTLLVVRSRFQSQLLAQAINYAAITPERNGLVFAVKGIFGRYDGYYSLMPYHQKVQQYGNLDQRDIWEYELDLNDIELRRLLMHTWELRNIASAYWFFDENCSYNLLFLIDAARPGLNLAQQTSWWVIPLDTVRLIQRAGLLRESHFRPSRSTRVRELGARLPAPARQAAIDLAWGRTTVEPALATCGDELHAQAQMLDVAAEYLQSLLGRKKISQADYQQRLLPMLRARAKTGLKADDLDQQIPVPPRPDQAHTSGRVSLAMGHSRQDGRLIEIGLRGAYHDLRDRSDGFLRGSQIEFGDARVRIAKAGTDIDLERLTVIGLRSFSVRDEFFQPPAWGVETGIVRVVQGRDGEADHHARLVGMYGAGWNLPGTTNGAFYALIEPDLRAFGRSPGYAFGVAPTLQIIAPFGPAWQFDATARVMPWLVGDDDADSPDWELSAGLRWAPATAIMLTADIRRTSTWDWLDTQWLAGFRTYF